MTEGISIRHELRIGDLGRIVTLHGECYDTLPGFGINNLSATWYWNELTTTLYADNAFDKYAVTGVRADQSFIRPVGQFDLRRYYNNVVRPREIGLRVNYRF